MLQFTQTKLIELKKIVGRRKSKKSFISKLSVPELDLSDGTKRGIAVVIFFLLTAISALGLAGFAGALGRAWVDLLSLLFGVLAYLTPILFLLISIMLLKTKIDEDEGEHIYFRTYLGVTLIFGAIAGIAHLFFVEDGMTAFTIGSSREAGGYLGAIFAGPLNALFGFWAGGLVVMAILIIGILVTFNVSIHHLIEYLQSKKKATAKQLHINDMQSGDFVQEPVSKKNKKLPAEDEYEEEEPEPKMTQEKINTSKVNLPSNDGIKLDSINLEDRKDWKLPPFDLLDDNKATVDSGNIESNVAIIQKTLEDFGISVEMGEVNVGPTVTQYTLRPTTGVKLSQIASLQNDIALALSAQSIRMELPIPGKPLVGLEVPNKSTAIVRLREVMQTKDFVDHKSKLAFAVGRDVAGRPYIADMARMPHLLVAGATNTGKSVAINSLLISLLYRNTPQDVKFIVVDPKRVEMTPFNGIPHLLTPVITESSKAVNALKWAVAEMDRRYKLLAEVGKRNIGEYNAINELQLPYIVILVDELADLMAVAQQEVEASIVRLAQMARAVGIHLVLATQRPSVQIITGLIKANITARIAFAVASQIDSRTILDSSGAEKLLGNGDLLITSAEFTKPKRMQGSYIGEAEVKKVVDFFKSQTGAVIYNEEITEKPKNSIGIPGLTEGDADDDLFTEAKDEVLRAGKASASLLQRRLRVGYARAARLLDMLEEQGIVGPADGAKPREVYGVSDEDREGYGDN